MAKYLGEHPQIFMPVAKELHYFGSDLDYRRRRPTRRRVPRAVRCHG